MTVAQGIRHFKTSGEVVNGKKAAAILIEPAGCRGEMGMKHQRKKTGVISQLSAGSPLSIVLGRLAWTWYTGPRLVALTFRSAHSIPT
jgi:hypothetical protein